MGKNQNANRNKANKFKERSNNFERLEEMQMEAAKRGIELEELQEELAKESDGSKSDGSDSDGGKADLDEQKKQREKMLKKRAEA